jgi:hypothetical protein
MKGVTRYIERRGTIDLPGKCPGDYKDTPMPDTDDGQNALDADVGQPRKTDHPEATLENLEVIAFGVMRNGQMNELLELVFEGIGDLGSGDLGGKPRPGIQAAIDAYRAWKRTQGGDMSANVGRSMKRRPDTVPLAYAGKWIAWSADGLRILAVGDSFEDCEQKALEAGFPSNQVAIGRTPRGRFRLDEGDL